MLTGNKDVDRKILNNLEDEDLVNVCQTNKKAQSLCNDQVFWMNRVFLRFGYVGGDILRKHKKNRSWSEYYIQDLRKINSSNVQKYLIDGSRNRRLDQAIISLNIGADIHADNDQALRLASEYGYLDIVKYLISAGANIHADDDYALRWASSNDHLDIVKYLISAGANIHGWDDGALRGASYHGHLDIVKYLISAGANIHAQDDVALRWASSYGHTEIVKYLISAGANIHAQSDDALRLASKYGHTEVVKYLKSLS